MSERDTTSTLLPTAATTATEMKSPETTGHIQKNEAITNQQERTR